MIKLFKKNKKKKNKCKNKINYCCIKGISTFLIPNPI